MKQVISIIAKVFTALLVMILALMLTLNILTLWSVNRIKNGEYIKSGYFSVIIGSGSMESTISVNDLLLIKGNAAYHTGDIITYVSSKGSLITHRIKEVSENGYVTQGDANNIPDSEISVQQVLGKVFYILPAAGAVIYSLLSPAGIFIMICAFIIFLLVESMGSEKNEINTEDKL